MEFDDFVTTQVRIYPEAEKCCRLVEASYTCEAKYVHMLSESEKRMVLGGLECVNGDDIAVKIQFKEPKVAFNSGREYHLTDYEWAIVKHDRVDDPVRVFRYLENDSDLIMVKITGEARLAVDMLRRPVKIDNRISMFVKDWQALQSWPCYDLKQIGAEKISSVSIGSKIRDGQVHLYQTEGRLMYALIMPWTKRKKLYIPLSRYDHPADDTEMWTERYLYKKEDSKFRAVYMFWGTQIVDIRTASYSWYAYTISENEYDLVLQMLNYVYNKDEVELPINASPRVGAYQHDWVTWHKYNPNARNQPLAIHRVETVGDLTKYGGFTEKSSLFYLKNQTYKIRLNQLLNKVDQPDLFPEED